MIRSRLVVTKQAALAPRGMVAAEHPRRAAVPARGGNFRRGRPASTAGAPGGWGIVSAIPQVVASLVDARGSVQAAVETPRVHTQNGDVLVNDRVGEAAVAALKRHRHAVVPKHESSSALGLARPVAIRVTPKGLEAGVGQYGATAAAGH